MFLLVSSILEIIKCDFFLKMKKSIFDMIWSFMYLNFFIKKLRKIRRDLRSFREKLFAKLLLLEFLYVICGH